MAFLTVDRFTVVSKKTTASRYGNQKKETRDDHPDTGFNGAASLMDAETLDFPVKMLNEEKLQWGRALTCLLTGRWMRKREYSQRW